jgi:hypothetical protein
MGRLHANRARRSAVAFGIIDEQNIICAKIESRQEQLKNTRVGFDQPFPARRDDPVEAIREGISAASDLEFFVAKIRDRETLGALAAQALEQIDVFMDRPAYGLDPTLISQQRVPMPHRKEHPLLGGHASENRCPHARAAR